MKKDLPKIEVAVRQMVADLVARKSHEEMLERWDKARGNAWFYSSAKRAA